MELNPLMRYKPAMTSRYDPSCPIARTLDLIGDSGSILILRDLLLEGPQRYQDFADRFSAISPNTLSRRLKTLEAAKLVERNYYSQHPPRAEYRLTEKGRELGPILRELRTWGTKHT